MEPFHTLTLKREAHLASAVIHGDQSWAPAASQCLHPFQSPQQWVTVTQAGAETETAAGSPTQFGFSFPDRRLLGPRKLLDHQCLQQEVTVT